MNLISFINNKEDSLQGNLPVALYPNRMIQSSDGKSSYYAQTTIRGVCTNSDIAQDLINAGLGEGLSKEQIEKLLSYADDDKLVRMADGFACDSGNFKSRLQVKGLFTSESDTYSTERHSIDIAVRATAKAKKAVSKIIPVIRQGNSRKPEITGVSDLKSKSGSTLTKGGFLEISGANIKICGDSEEVGLFFVNRDDSSKSVKLSAEELGINKAATIACVVPAELESGTYSIKIVTQFMNSLKVFRKEPQAASYGEFTVA